MANMLTVLANPDGCDCDETLGSCQHEFRVEKTFPQQSDLSDFATKIDAPCNYDDCPSNLSFCSWDYDDHVGCDGDHHHSIAIGETASWTWTNPANLSNNYLAPKSCLFNFNNISLFNTDYPNDTSNATGDYVKFSVRVNNGNSVDFYHTKVYGHHMFHSVELTDLVFTQNGGYDDAPGHTNTLHLTVDSTASRGLYFHDGEDANPSDPGRVNIYRVYQTVKLNEQKTITVNQNTGGTISPGTTNVWTYHDQTFTITPQSGYFISHVYADGVDKGAINSYLFNNVTDTHTISATFIPIPYYQVTINCDPNCGYITQGSSGTYQYGTELYIWAESNEGYIIDHWTDNEQEVQQYQKYIYIYLTADHTVEPIFASGWAQPATVGYQVLVNEGIYDQGTYYLCANTWFDFTPGNIDGCYLYGWIIDGNWGGDLSVWIEPNSYHYVQYFYYSY